MMAKVCLSLGSNHDDRALNVENGLIWIGGVLDDLRCSEIYETPEVYGRGRSYFNAVVIGMTTLSLEELNSRLKLYEFSCGRDAAARARGEVIIDIDVVIWNEDIIRPVDFSREFFKIGYDSIV